MEDKLKEWKLKFGELIKVQSEEEVAYLKRPTVSEIEEYNKLKKEDAYLALEFLFKSCVLEYDKSYEDEFILSASKSLLEELPEANDFILSKESGVDGIKKSAALVRHFFHVDPYELSIDKFYKLVGEALWLQEHKNKQLEVALANVLVKTFDNGTF
ncbi:hypothetical protein [Tenacibaculum sp. 190524A05c]|uniref:hypothetical protein n=1 Tax=Tenacibaculum platacis TaxID=3137852 RepID=UPI0032B20507